MDLKQIEIALSVAEHLSFSEAAFETNCSLSSVSKHVKRLEEELGIRLFFRNGRSQVTVTPWGQTLLPYFRRIMDSYNDMNLHIKHTLRDKGNFLTLACPNGFSTLGEDALIANFYLKYPETTIYQIVSGTMTILSMMEEGKVDIGMSLVPGLIEEHPVFKTYCIDDKLAFIPLKENRLIMAVSSNSSHAMEKAMDLASLKDETFLFRKFYDHIKDDSLLTRFITACKREGFIPNIKYLDKCRPAVAFNLVAAGQAMMPLFFMPDVIYPGVTYLPLAKDYFTARTVLYYMKNNKSLALKKFIKFCTSYQSHD